MTLRFLLCLSLLSLSGCSILSKADALRFRYFSAAPAPGAASKASGALELRLVNAASHVTTKMAYRLSDHEVNEYETLRWTEDPSEYLRLGLQRALFEKGNLRRALSGKHPGLEVELTSFEASRNEDEEDAVAHVSLRAFLYDHKGMSLAFKVLEAEQAVAEPGDPNSVAQAMAKALEETIAELVKTIDAALSKANQGG